MKYWIGVDLDGTLATWQGDGDVIGYPIPRMIERVKFWLGQGKRVKIFSARASEIDPEQRKRNIKSIENWCALHLNTVLEVTCIKDFDCVEIWDDKAVRVIRNSGMTEMEYRKRRLDPFEKRVRTRRITK